MPKSSLLSLYGASVQFIDMHKSSLLVSNLNQGMLDDVVPFSDLWSKYHYSLHLLAETVHISLIIDSLKVWTIHAWN